MYWLIIIGVLLIGYLLGSLPTGFLVGRAKGIDVRKVGSGNIGATNAFRVLGKPAGALVLLVDALKGYAAAAWIPLLVLKLTGESAVSLEALALAGGVSAILGHNYTCWLGFRGGKGIATSAGVLLALVPMALLITFCVWLLTFLISRYVSLASIFAAVALPFATWWRPGTLRMIGVMTVLSLLAIYKHRSNIQRLLNGTEHRMGARKEGSPG